MKKEGLFIFLLLSLCFSLTLQATSSIINIDSLFSQYQNKQSRNLAKQLIDSFAVYDCYDYPILQKHYNNEQFAQMLVYLGMANYAYSRGSFYAAERFAQKALLYQIPDSLRWTSSCYEILNVTQQRTGQFQSALIYARMDYKIGEELKEERILSSALNSLACINLYTEHAQDALNYINQAIEIERKNNTDKGKALAIRLGIKSEILMALDRPEEALECIDEAIAIDQQNNRPVKVSIRMSQKSDILLHQQNWAECKTLCLEAMKVFEQNNSVADQVITLKQLGMCEMALNNYNAAEQYLLEGEQLCKQHGFMPLLWRIQSQLSKLYEKINQTEKALSYLESSYSIKDSLNSEKYQALLSEYQVAFDIHQKDEKLKEQQVILHRHLFLGTILIIILTLSFIVAIFYISLARLRKKNNETLLEQNKINNQIYSIISHDLRNPVNAQKQILEYVCNQYDHIKEEDKRIMIEEVHKSNNALSELLVNLLEWASLECGRLTFNPIRLNLGSVIQKEIRQIQPILLKKNISISKQIPNDIFVLSDMTILEIVIRNLLTNAVKYSHEDGTVELKVDEDNDKATVYFIDHGIGMLPEETDLIFKKEFVTTPGTSGETGTGIGLMVCKELINRTGGTISFTSKHLEGSTFFFTIPKTTNN